MEENKTSWFKKIKSIRWSLILLWVVSGIIIFLFLKEREILHDLLQTFLRLIQFSLPILFLYFIYLVVLSNVINEWLKFKIKQPKWKKFLMIALFIFLATFVFILLELWLNIKDKNAEQTLIFMETYFSLFLISLEFIIGISSLYISYFIDFPRQLKSKLNEIPHELIIKYPTEAIRKAFVMFESILREKIAAPIELSGEKLISEAFNKEKGRLIYSIVESEQNGVRNLIAGFYAVYRNPIMHHDKEKDIRIAELILLQLDEFMEIVETSQLRDN